MDWKEIKEELINKRKNNTPAEGSSLWSKLAGIAVLAFISFLPFRFIQSNLKDSIGDQPRVLLVMYLSMFGIVALIALALIKTRNKRN